MQRLQRLPMRHHPRPPRTALHKHPPLPWRNDGRRRRASSTNPDRQRVVSGQTRMLRRRQLVRMALMISTESRPVSQTRGRRFCPWTPLQCCQRGLGKPLPFRCSSRHWTEARSSGRAPEEPASPRQQYRKRSVRRVVLLARRRKKRPHTLHLDAGGGITQWSHWR